MAGNPGDSEKNPINALTNKWVVGYTRVSSREQRDGWSLGNQESAIRNFCNSNGLKLLDLYSDPGRSGGSMVGRLGLNAALKSIEEGSLGALVVTREDRLARSIADAIDITTRLHQAKAAVIILEPMKVDLPGGSGEPGGFDVRKLHMIISEDERDRIRGRVIPGISTAASKGHRGGHTPLGYRRVDAGTWALDEVLAPVIKDCFERVAAGEKRGTVLRSLAEHQKRGDGRRITREQLDHLLRNRFYLGEFNWTVPQSQRSRLGERIGLANHHPRLIDPRLFARVQKALDSDRQQGQPRPPRQVHGLLPPSVLRCGTCGGPVHCSLLTFGSRLKRVKRVCYYCSAHQRLGAVACDQLHGDQEMIDAGVESSFRAAIAAGQFAYRLPPAIPADVGDLEKRITELTLQCERLGKVLELPEGRELVQQRLAEKRRELDGLRGEIVHQRTVMRLPQGPRWAILRDFTATWDSLSLPARRELITDFLVSATFGHRGVCDLRWRGPETVVDSNHG
jgi:DNA invertase Pin-like site-specific DNA recombinase